jgi:hypothetical protein
VSESQNQPVQLSFDRSWNVDFRGHLRLTRQGGRARLSDKGEALKGNPSWNSFTVCFAWLECVYWQADVKDRVHDLVEAKR